MTNTVYTASQAVARSYGWSSYPVGQCLNWVWKCIDYPHLVGIPDANAAYNLATMRRTSWTPPPGAPVYFAGGSHGHIALSLGGGNIRSTDWPYSGRVGNTTISRLCSAWGKTYRGWSLDYAGRTIPGLGAVVSYPGGMSVDSDDAIRASNLRPGARNTDVARFERALYNYLGGAYRLKIAASRYAVGDGYYGTLTSRMCSDAYAKAGMGRATYPGGTALLRVLGFSNARV